MKKFLILLFLINLISCRGGNREDTQQNEYEYSGTYRGDVSLSYNNCPTSSPVSSFSQTISLKHLSSDPLEPGRAILVFGDGIGEIGDEVGYPTLNTTNDKVTLYFPDADGASKLSNFIIESTCTEIVDYTFNEFNSGYTHLLRDSYINCNSGNTNFSCRVTYIGNLKKDE